MYHCNQYIHTSSVTRQEPCTVSTLGTSRLGTDQQRTSQLLSWTERYELKIFVMNFWLLLQIFGICGHFEIFGIYGNFGFSAIWPYDFVLLISLCGRLGSHQPVPHTLPQGFHPQRFILRALYLTFSLLPLITRFQILLPLCARLLESCLPLCTPPPLSYHTVL